MAAKDGKDVKDVKDKTTSSVKLLTREEVSRHNDGTDAWVIIHDSVYDITSFIVEHPGGEEVLLEQVGRDATEPFEDIGHSSDAREMMQKFKVGEIVEEERSKPAKTAKGWSNGSANGSSGSWRSWLIPIALGILATLVYRYFINIF